MNETEPFYIKELKEQIGRIDHKIDEVLVSTAEEFRRIDKRFDQVDERFDKIDRRFELVDEKFSKIDNEFEGVNNRLDRLESSNAEIKEDISKIEGHIGRYEVRAQNIEAILLEDHKPRIIALEKEVFA